MIKLQGITKTYGKKKALFTALDDISLTIQSGECVAIVGKSGSGKSTLMHIMSGLDRPNSGEIIVDDENLFKLKQKKLDTFRAKKIGFIFQSFFVQSNESCFHNVALSLEINNVPSSRKKKMVIEALESVGLSEKIKQKAGNLSGGQKQRLAIARAIVSKPSIIFADEPTGNLDSENGKIVEDLLFDLNKKSGTTLIIVTHDADLAKKADRQIIVKDGKILKDSGAKNETN